MTKRKKIPKKLETDVLLASARRCCLCFGLHNDMCIKQGQIAHLNHNPSDNSFDNIAFLCLQHHNWYDTRASQSKGMTMAEVKVYRDALYVEVRKMQTANQTKIENLSLPEESNSFVNTDNISITSFNELIQLADQLSLSTERDQEYTQLIQLALAHNEIDKALKIIDLLSLSTLRDQELWSVFEFCLSNEQINFMKRIIPRFSIQIHKDRATKKLLTIKRE